MLLNGINHVAMISANIERLGAFYRTVFDADVGPTEPHGEDGGETMTMIRIGPHTELNVVTIEGNREPDRQTPMWGRGRLDHLGLQAASHAAFNTIVERLTAHGASDGTVNDFGGVHSVFFRDPDGLEGEVLAPTPTPTESDDMSIPGDDPTRELAVTNRDDNVTTHVFLAGDVYSILVSGSDTDGRYTLIDMAIPDGGGPPPHRHDFEEMFTVLDGEIEFTFRETTMTATSGTTLNIPANAPHHFINRSGRPARMLCMCTPAGQDEFFARVGDILPTRTTPPPRLSPDEITERQNLAAELAPHYRTEML